MCGSKLKILLILFLIIPNSLSLKAQSFKNFILKGNISGIKDGDIELWWSLDDINPDIQIVTKRVRVSNGVFEFKGKIAHPFSVSLYNRERNISSPIFFLDFGIQSFVSNIDSFNSLIPTIVGSKVNNEYLDRFKPYFKSIKKEIDDWYLSYQTLQDISPVIEDSMQNRVSSLNKIKDSIFYNYASKYPKSYVILWTLGDRLTEHNGYNKLIDEAYNHLDTSLRNTYTGKLISKHINVLKRTTVGVVFPNKEMLVDTGINKIKLPFNGASRYTYIDLWFSRCGPCRMQLPLLNVIYAKYKKYGFNMIGISVRESNDKDWKKAIKDENLLWPQYWDKNGFFINELSINIYPSNFLIDTQGKIIARNLVPSQLETFLIGHITQSQIKQ